MKADAYKAFKKMRKAAKADGIRFKICSAYRTYSTQKWLYNNYLNTMGKKLRDIRSAYPGRSEHHTGYAIDLVTKSTGWTLTQDFAKTSEGKWINKHCAEYGFIIRYPENCEDITRRAKPTLQATIMSLGICAMSALMPLRKSQSRALLWKNI